MRRRECSADPEVPASGYVSLRSGRGSAWLERLVRDQEVGGSNPLAPTNFRLSFSIHFQGLLKHRGPQLYRAARWLSLWYARMKKWRLSRRGLGEAAGKRKLRLDADGVCSFFHRLPICFFASIDRLGQTGNRVSKHLLSVFDCIRRPIT